MNQNQPTPRTNTFYSISDDLHLALKDAFPSEFQTLIAVTKDGNVQVLVPKNATFVERNPTTGKCSVIKANGNSGLIGKEIKKREVSCNSKEVKELSEGKVAVETNPVSVTIFKNSGCICSGGGYFYW